MIRSVVARVRADEDLSSLVSNGGSLYLAGGVAVGLTLLQQLLTARSLGSADYGFLATCLGYVLLVLLVIDVRSWELATRILAQPLDTGDREEAARRFTWLVLAEVGCGVAGTCVIWMISPWLSSVVFGSSSAVSVLMVLGAVIPMRQVSTGASAAMVRMLGRFHWLSVRSVVTAVVRVVAIVAPASAGLGVTSVAVGVLVAESFSALTMLATAAVAFQREFRRLPFAKGRPDCLREATRLAKDLWISASIKGLHTESFIPVAALFMSSAQVGTLRTGLDVAGVTTHVAAPVGMIIGPKIVLLAQRRSLGDLRRYLRISGRVLAGVVGSTVALGVPTVLFVLPTVVGDGFVSVRTSAAVLLLGFGASAGTLWVRHVLVGMDRVSVQNRLGIIGGVISLILLPPLASRWGAVGAALDLSTFLLVYSALSVRIAQKALQHVH